MSLFGTDIHAASSHLTATMVGKRDKPRMQIRKILQKFSLHSLGTSLGLQALAPISGNRKLFDSFSH